ncbi:hypothetical protein L249_4622, partial [Ophiocordyceps polyrhachis-furcata BCC 54312]
WGYSGHSARIDSLQRSDRRAVPIAVIAPDLDGRTKSSSKSPIFQVKYLKKENTYQRTESSLSASTSSLLQYNHLSCLQFFFNPHKTTIT